MSNQAMKNMGETFMHITKQNKPVGKRYSIIPTI